MARLGRFLDKLKGVVAPVAKVGAPIVGGLVGGAPGAILAGGLTSGLSKKGDFGDKLSAGLKGAAVGAATSGAMSALKGAVGGTQAAGAVTDAAVNPALAQAGNAANAAAKAATAAPAAAAGGFGQIDPTMAAKTMFAPAAAAQAVQGTIKHDLTQAAASGAVPTTPPELFAAPPDLSQPSLPSVTSEVGGQMIAPEGYVPMEQRMFTPTPGGVRMDQSGNLVGDASFGQTALAGPQGPMVRPPQLKSPQGRLMSALTGIGQWAGENPELALGIASAAEGIFAQDPRERELEYMMQLNKAKANIAAALGLYDDFELSPSVFSG